MRYLYRAAKSTKQRIGAGKTVCPHPKHLN